MGSDAISIASALVDVGSIDTMYRDVYLGRARTLLSPVVSLEAFHGMEQRRSALASLPLAVARALEKADWPQVRELSLRADAVKQEISPSDVHFRLGEAEGWGRKPFWTHFDGYLIRFHDGQLRLQALAGGDVRYGGLYDILGVGRDLDSDRLLARFAVVHRERMVAW